MYARARARAPTHKHTHVYTYIHNLEAPDNRHYRTIHSPVSAFIRGSTQFQIDPSQYFFPT